NVSAFYRKNLSLSQNMTAKTIPMVELKKKNSPSSLCHVHFLLFFSSFIQIEKFSTFIFGDVLKSAGSTTDRHFVNLLAADSPASADAYSGYFDHHAWRGQSAFALDHFLWLYGQFLVLRDTAD